MLKSKFLFIFLAILILLNVFTAYSSAFTLTYEGEKLEFGDIEENLKEFTIVYPYYYNGEFDSIYLFSSDIEPVIVDIEKNIVRVSGICYQGRYTNGKFTVIRNNVEYNSSTAFSVSSVIYSTFDLKDTKGNVVFQRPVLGLGEVLEITTPMKTFQITMRGMIVSLAVCLVSLVAFWKAWSLLSNSLRKA